MILSVDIETIPLDSALALPYPEAERQPPANYKNPEAIAKWRADDASAWARERVKDYSTNPYTGRVLAVGWADGDSEPNNFLAGQEEYEKVLLEHAWSLLRKADRLVTFNGQGFDLPFIRTRSILLGVKPSVSGDVIGSWFRRYAYAPHFDVMQALANWDNRQWRSLAFFAKQLLDEDKGHDSSTVFDRFLAGDVSGVGASAASDARQTLAIYERIRQFFPNR